MQSDDLDFYLRDTEYVSLAKRAEPLLLVDDSSSMRGIVIRILNSLGIRDVDTAEDARKAFKKMHSRRYKAVLCDVVMEDVNGIQLVKACRENAQTAAVPFLMMTTSLNVRFVAQSKGRAEAYILKPFTAEGLQRRLDEILPYGGDELERDANEAHTPRVPRYGDKA